MKKIHIFILFMAVCLFSCSTASVYQRADGPEREGYFDNPLQTDIYEVTFNGNSSTNGQRVYDYALLRAAELCIENGYKTFSILNFNNNTKTTTDPITVYNNTMYHNYATTYITSTTYPKITLVIKCSKDSDLTFIADQLKENIRNKYKMDEKEVK